MRHFFTNRLVWFSLVVSVGIGALFARTLWTIRTDEWDFANQTGNNLSQTIEQGLAWTLDSFDKSIQGAAREVVQPEVWALSPDLRDRLVFDNSLRARGAGDILVLNAGGQIILNSTPGSGSGSDTQPNFSGRDFFLAFKEGGHQGLFIGRPITSSLDGNRVLPLARAYFHPDGSFAGLVVGNLRLSYLNDLLKSLDLGGKGGVNLYSVDGTVITRFPYSDKDPERNIADSPNFVRILKDNNGAFVGNATVGDAKRLYSFHRVGEYPLIVNVAQAVSSIDEQWYGSVWTLGGFAIVLMVACVTLAILFVRELTLRQKVSSQLRIAEHNVHTILDNTPSMIGYWDAQLHNGFANRAYNEWFGVPPEKLLGMELSELLGPELFALNKPMLERTLRGEPQLFELTITDVQGITRHTLASYVPDIQDGVVCGIFVQITDISERKRMADELFEEKERARLTLQAIGDAVVCTDANGLVTYVKATLNKPGQNAIVLTRLVILQKCGRICAIS